MNGDATLAELDRAIIAAHGRGDKRALADLYHQAGQQFLAQGQTGRAGFLLTQAYVLALDCGNREHAAVLWGWLKAEGREN